MRELLLGYLGLMLLPALTVLLWRLHKRSVHVASRAGMDPPLRKCLRGSFGTHCLALRNRYSYELVWNRQSAIPWLG
jgi:hypothetical protein